MAKAAGEKGKRLGTVDEPPDRPGGDVAPLPPYGQSLAILVATLVAGGGAFVYLLWWLLAPKPGWAVFFATIIGAYLMTRHLPGLRERTALRSARRDARRLVKAVQSSLKKQGPGLGSEAREKLEGAITTLTAALPSNDLASLEFATKKLDEAADQHLVRKPAGREYVEQIGGAILVALLIRAFSYEAFRIPSGSMIPTLLEGDHLFVNKFTYGLRVPFTLTKFFTQVPERGDIVVFNKPTDPDGEDIIKRVVGLPGDVVEVRDRRITVNGEPLPTKTIEHVDLNVQGDDRRRTEDGLFGTLEIFEESVGEHVHLAASSMGEPDPRSEGQWTVEPGHVFVMGDNRDNSLDSRFGPSQGGFGQVPLELIKGRADVIWLSLGGPQGIRFDRMFSLIH